MFASSLLSFRHFLAGDGPIEINSEEANKGVDPSQAQVQDMNNASVNAPMNQQVYKQQNTSGIPAMNTSNKSSAGSLGLGNASNMYYKSNSNGVGQPPRY